MMEALQYGALGLLAIVLTAIGIWLRDYLRRRDEREDNTSQYLQRLVDEDRADRKEHETAWRLLIEEDIKIKLQLAEALNGLIANQKQIIEAQRVSEMQVAQQHKALMDRLVLGKE